MLVSALTFWIPEIYDQGIPDAGTDRGTGAERREKRPSHSCRHEDRLPRRRRGQMSRQEP